MKNKIKNIFKILAVTAGCLLFASFSPSLDGRAVVVDKGVFPQGLFAKTVGYLPGDIISVTNIAGDQTIDLLVIGALDPSEGVAIMLSPEAADAMGIDKGANNIVKITKRSGQDERVYGNAVISKSAAEIEDWDDGNFENISAEENTEAFDDTAKSPLVEPEAEDDFEEETVLDDEEATEEDEEAFDEEEAEDFEEEDSEADEEEDFDAEEEEAFDEEEEDADSEEAEDEEYEEEFADEESDEEIEEEAEEEEFEEEADAEEFEDETPEELEESVEAEAFEADELDELPAEEAVEEPEEEASDEELSEDLPEEEAAEEEDIPSEEGFDEEAFDAETPDELPAEEAEEEPAEETDDEAPAEEAFDEDELEALPEENEEAEEPEESEESDEYEAIVLVPVDSNPPESDSDSDEVEDVISDTDIDALNEEINFSNSEINSSVSNITTVTPAETKPAAGNATSYDKYMVPSLKDLESGKYYIQIAVYGSDDNILDVINKYGANYPITIVPMAGGKTKQVLVGPVTMDEYKVVLERFKSYGFKDAFLRKIK